MTKLQTEIEEMHYQYVKEGGSGTAFDAACIVVAVIDSLTYSKYGKWSKC